MKFSFLAALFILLLPLTGCGEKTAEEKSRASVLFQQEFKKLSPQERFSYVVKKVEEGDADAQNKYGIMYDDGDGVSQDSAKAMEWYQKAAAQGNADAQLNIGMKYMVGRDIPKDYSKGAEWLQKSAAQGFARGQLLLGASYNLGKGVSKDRIQAYAWFNLAAAQGDEDAKSQRDGIEKYMPLAERTEGQRLASNWKKGDTTLHR